ncbi:NAD(P)-dependent glycerol-1-phosphate dehydrogenase [Pyrococcus furiosus DSM 3638]|uniref:Glycerol-1-phosphate dehydrogenase [NAD(P)+] n=3 Tax=Pyrococcus furiosus TaxID=2261 RepID=G1PDH_PYRFU|nr:MULTISPECIES: NAD(P)-dependent glycerol-1-phosphate dehydrogenase [Pyrococcus]Q8U147.2 RecName: Full=Glycerol-1-phosphate dehydrogenase [NAD(P)+]; Short=G1P dehydrogenase; Short=G1PDH; AltName: Full=Enantiomeric glycerophosphate synthase; AltName: Full=sn-glycerol-1-phosphate dehydrogenase [Pyrococcus furiosus DSM 3638]AFN04163.1 NAD(P)-dependent glycerol-1-phosphate dehydrogenase [Pyrococcus furiosus COM1]MDK2868895.1 glycerol-phosphate dehydrogenase [Pyrococcus sp.]QEK79016.1 NAD(P)-depend
MHIMEFPREVILGKNVISETVNVAKRLSFSSPVLVVYGPKTKEIAGKDVERVLKEEFDVHSVIVKEATINEVEKVEGIIRDNKVKWAIAVGGGTIIDVTKLASYRAGIPFVSFPTTASHDGIASANASIKGLGTKTSIKARPPVAVIADIRIIKSAPRRYLAAGVGDVISNITAVRDWKLAHKIKGEYFSEYAAALSLMSAKMVMRDAEIIRIGDDEGVRKVVKALISSGVAMSIAGSSRPASGAEHLFSHALDLLLEKPALHGEQTGIGTIIMAYLHGINWRKIKETLQKVGAPTTAYELGVDPEIIIEALTIAHTIRPERYTILGRDGLTREAAERAAKITGVI